MARWRQRSPAAAQQQQPSSSQTSSSQRAAKQQAAQQHRQGAAKESKEQPTSSQRAANEQKVAGAAQQQTSISQRAANEQPTSSQAEAKQQPTTGGEEHKGQPRSSQGTAKAQGAPSSSRQAASQNLGDPRGVWRSTGLETHWFRDPLGSPAPAPPVHSSSTASMPGVTSLRLVRQCSHCVQNAQFTIHLMEIMQSTCWKFHKTRVLTECCRVPTSISLW